MLINLSELLTVNGKERDYELSLDMQAVKTPAGEYRLKQDEPVRIHAVHPKNREIVLQTAFAVSLQIPCDRCLNEVTVPVSASFEVTVDLDASDEQRLEALDEQPYINGYELDVDCLVYGELLLNLPDKVLCSQGCKGICRVCGTNLNESACACDQEPVNLRMSMFQEIFNANNIKEV